MKRKRSNNTPMNWKLSNEDYTFLGEINRNSKSKKKKQSNQIIFGYIFGYILMIAIAIFLLLFSSPNNIKIIIIGNFFITWSFLIYFIIRLPDFQQLSKVAYGHLIFLMLTIIVNLSISTRNTILDSTFGIIIITFLILCLIFFLRSIKEIKDHKIGLTQFLFIPLLTFALYSCILAINITFDRSESTISESVVFSKHYTSSYKSSTSYYVYVFEENQDTYKKYRVPSTLYKRVNSNDCVFVLRHNGFFHIRWAEIKK